MDQFAGIQEQQPAELQAAVGRARRRPASRARRIWRKVEEWIVWLHRWIGIGVCLLCLIWCLSGVVLIYVIQPKLTEQEYRAGLDPIAWSQVQVDPLAAIGAAGLDRFPRDLRLEMSAGRPVYFLSDWSGAHHAVSATDGRRLGPIDSEQALRIASAFAHSSRPTWTGLIDKDRWTFKAPFDDLRPYHLIRLHDSDEREIYVSARNGEVVMDTSRFDRVWSWFARVPHLFEVPAMRTHPQVWRQLMLWATALATVVAVSGLWIGFRRLSLLKRYGGRRVSPFRGMMMWHHVLGVIGGVTLFTWAATAWIYLRPAAILQPDPPSAADVRRYHGHDAPDFPMAARAIAPLAAAHLARSVGFTWIAGHPIAFIVQADGRLVTVDGRTGDVGRLSDAQLIDAAQRLILGAAVAKIELRDKPDLYWHSFKGNYRKLPIVRVQLADRSATWLHLDPRSGEILNTITVKDRAYFWFFNVVHKFDVFVIPEPFRKILVWGLLIGGTGISATGVVVGWRQLTRPRVRKAARRNPAVGT